MLTPSSLIVKVCLAAIIATIHTVSLAKRLQGQASLPVKSLTASVQSKPPAVQFRVLRTAETVNGNTFTFRVKKSFDLNDISIRVFNGKLERKSIEFIDGSQHSIVKVTVAKPKSKARVRVEYQLTVEDEQLPWNYEFDVATRQLTQHLTLLNPLVETLPGATRMIIRRDGVELLHGQLTGLGGSLQPKHERTETRLVETQASLDRLWLELKVTPSSTAMPRELAIDHSVRLGQSLRRWPAGELQIVGEPAEPVDQVQLEHSISALQPFVSPLDDPLCCGTKVCEKVTPALYRIGTDAQVRIQQISPFDSPMPLVIGIRNGVLLACETQTHRIDLVNLGGPRELGFYRKEASWRVLPSASDMLPSGSQVRSFSVHSVHCSPRDLKPAEFPAVQLYQRYLELMMTGDSTVNPSNVHLLMLNGQLADELLSMPEPQRAGKLNDYSVKLLADLKALADASKRDSDSNGKLKSLNQRLSYVFDQIAAIHALDDPDPFWRQLRELKHQQQQLQRGLESLKRASLTNDTQQQLSVAIDQGG
ncbi:MAG: hypothetical protein Aurels2KO_50820 [Aureliella sp.]